MKFTYRPGKTLKHRFHLYPSPPLPDLRSRVLATDDALVWCDERMPNQQNILFARITPVSIEIDPDDAAMEFRLRWC